MSKELEAASYLVETAIYKNKEDNRVFDCPHCGDTWFYSNDSDEWKFCPNCGQRLNWSDEDE